jgi:ring-1,2-phenylacetyl-CoA epoxidase subunit PaaC
MHETPLFAYALRLADNALILGHRLSEWVGHAPALEEELALGNMGLDLIGQARAFYTYAGEVEGKGRDEDKLAYFRDAKDWRNVLLVEQPNGDFAATVIRQFLFAAYAHPLYAALSKSRDETLAAIAAKAEKEMAYHIRHSGEWVIRLGDGTPESHERAQAALDELYAYSNELFESDEIERALIEAGIAADPAGLRGEWDRTTGRVFAEATLKIPPQSFGQTGGRKGRHSEHLGYILADMQFLQRTYPGAQW